MLKKSIHLVFGHTNQAVLLHSGLLNPEKEDVLMLTDPLSLGPLFAVDDAQGTQNRCRWWIENVDEHLDLAAQSHRDFFGEDCNRIRKLSADLSSYHAMYLWFGEDSNEKIALARLLHYLRDFHIPLFKLDFINNPGTRNSRGTLYVLKPEELPEVAKHFYELDTQHRKYWESLWEQLLTDEATLRFFDKSNRLLTGDHRFFDTVLLEKCTPEPKSAALIVGLALTTIWDTYGLTGIGDTFLFQRLNQLGSEGIINITDRHADPKRSHMFKVCMY